MKSLCLASFWPALCVFVLAFALYANTLSHEYALDDAIVITDNKFVKQGLTAESLKGIFFNDTFLGFFGTKKNLVAGGRYRPLSLFTFAIENAFFGMSPLVSHLFNILFYALTGIIIYLLLKRLIALPDPRSWYVSIPFIAAILFVAHPLHTEVVANIKGRDEILTMLLSLLALWFTLDALETKRFYNSILAAFMLFLGLLSKENAVTWLLVIPLALLTFTKYDIRRVVTSTLPLIGSFILFMFLRKAILGDIGKGIPDELMNNPFLHASGTEKFATIFYTLGIYIKLLFFPHPLTYDYYPYHIPIVGWDFPGAYISLLFYLFLAFYLIRGIRISRWVLFPIPVPKTASIFVFGIAYYFITFSIVSNLFFPIGAFMNERFVYMSSLAFVLIVAAFMVQYLPKIVPARSASKWLTLVLLVFITSLYSFKTVTRNVVWKNDFTLFTSDVNVSVNSAKSNCSAGGKLLEESSKLSDSTKKKEYVARSVKYLRKSISIHPTYRDALLLMGNAQWDYQKNFDSVLYYYLQVVRISPDYDLIYNNIDLVLTNCNDVDQRIRLYESVFADNPNRFSVNYQLGNLYGKFKNDISRSMFYLRRAERINPNKDKALLKDLGVAMAMSNKYDSALMYFSRALQVDPNDADVYMNMSVTYKVLGDTQKAAAFMNEGRKKMAATK